MKFKVFILLLLSALLLGCELEKEVDEKVLNYISENDYFKINTLNGGRIFRKNEY